MTKRKSSSSSKKVGLKEFLAVLFLMLVAWAAQEFLGLDLLSESPPAIESEPTGAMQVLFTAPRYPDDAAHHYGGLDEKLAAAIDAAAQSIDVAAFELDLERVTDALVRAKQRGIQVRVVTDSDYEDELGPERLHKAKIPIIFDERSPFMHNKFVIIDDYTVWTGSWNLTDNGTYRNNNNVVIVQSKNLAENYTAEFEEMFIDEAFGASSPDDTPHPRIDLDGVELENFFESEGAVAPRIVELVEAAQESVYFMAFVFTDDAIAKALIERHRAGVQVQGVVEARSASITGSDFDAMRKAQIDVLEDGNPYVLHHKVIIIDESIVVMGSYNFSRSAAEKNDENVLIIHSPDVAAQYVAEFERVYQRAQEGQ